MGESSNKVALFQRVVLAIALVIVVATLYPFMAWLAMSYGFQIDISFLRVFVVWLAIMLFGGSIAGVVYLLQDDDKGGE